MDPIMTYMENMYEGGLYETQMFFIKAADEIV